MKKFVIAVLIIQVFSFCSSEINLQEVELSELDFFSSNFEAENDTIINFKSTRFSIYPSKTEKDIWIKTSNTKLHDNLIKYFNSQYNLQSSSLNLNAWHTDSSEILLYKKSDSCILVNIYNKTH